MNEKNICIYGEFLQESFTVPSFSVLVPSIFSAYHEHAGAKPAA